MVSYSLYMRSTQGMDMVILYTLHSALHVWFEIQTRKNHHYSSYFVLFPYLARWCSIILCRIKSIGTLGVILVTRRYYPNNNFKKKDKKIINIPYFPPKYLWVKCSSKARLRILNLIYKI